MEKIKIAYVVLHYKNVAVTIKCLNYLIDVMGDNSATVVVDNYSQNNSLDEIKTSIGDNNKIHYLCNSENLGFARGNNLGYEYARKILNANCIVVMNNDIFIDDLAFEKKLCVKEIIDNYFIIAPDIVTLSEVHQNPFRYKKVSTWKLFRGMILQYCYSWLFRVGILIPSVVQKYYNNSVFKKDKVCENLEDIVPHGSCIIFTPSYVQKERFAFVPVTFFYGEEDMLYDYALYRNYKTIYYPQLRVIHAEKQSTKLISKSELNILRFRSTNKARSLRICLKYRLFPEKFKNLMN